MVLVFVLLLLQLSHAQFAGEPFKTLDHNGVYLPWKDGLSEIKRLKLHKLTTGDNSDENNVLEKPQKNKLASSLEIGPWPENEGLLSVGVPFKTNMLSVPLSIPIISASFLTATDESLQSSTPDSESTTMTESIQTSKSESESTIMTESIQTSTPDSESSITTELIQNSTPDSESSITPESIKNSTPDSESSITTESIQNSTPDSESSITTESIQNSTPDSESSITTESIQNSTPDSESSITAESLQNSTPDPESSITTESPQTSKPDSDKSDKITFWNPWTISLVALGAFLVSSIIVVSAYHIGKIRTRDMIGYPPDETEPQRIIPRVKSYFRKPLPYT